MEEETMEPFTQNRKNKDHHKLTQIPGAVIINHPEYHHPDGGLVREIVDYTELSHSVVGNFTPESQYVMHCPKDVIRGGHMEHRSKLVSIVSGQVYYVLVDMRPGSSYGQVSSFILGEGDGITGTSVLVPEGVVDMFVPLKDSIYVSVADRHYNYMDSNLTLNMFDPALGLKDLPSTVHPYSDLEERSLINLADFQAAVSAESTGNVSGTMKEADRCWFTRNVWDPKTNRRIEVEISTSPTGYKDNDKDLMPRHLKIEDKTDQTSWTLSLRHENSQPKLDFRKFKKSGNTNRSKDLGLCFLPDWATDELCQVVADMKSNDLDPKGQDFLVNLLERISKEKLTETQKLKDTFKETGIPGLMHIVSPVHPDPRGSFREVVRMPDLELMTGYDLEGKQENHSHSTRGVLRGFHYEPWAKLVTVTSGLTATVLLDCRPGSSTFGQTETLFLGFGTNPEGEEVKGGALFIPQGVAFSILTLSDSSDLLYVVDKTWTPETRVFAINPFSVGVDWDRFMPADKILISERDQNARGFSDYQAEISSKS